MKTSLAHVTSKFFHRVRTWRSLLIVTTVCIALLGQGTASVSASNASAIESLPRFVRPSDTNDDAAKIADEEAKKAAEAAEKAAKEAREAAEKAAKETREAAEKTDKEEREAAEKVAKKAREAADKAVESAWKAAKEAREAAKDAREAGDKAVKEVREAAQKSAKEAREAAEKAAKAAREAAEKIAKAAREKSPEEAAKEAREAALTAAKEAREAALTAAKEAREAAEKAEDALTELELAEDEFDLLSDKIDEIRDRIARATSASTEKSLRALLNRLQKLQLSAAKEWAESVHESLKSSAEAAYEQDKRAIAMDYRTAILTAVTISDSAAREAAIIAAKVARDARMTESRAAFLAAKFDARRYLGRAQVITFLTPESVLETAGTFTVAATSTSGLAVVVTSDSPSICTVNGTEVSIIEAGQCALTATQAGTGQFAPAQAVSSTVTVIVVPTTTTSTTTIPSTTTTVSPTTTTP